MDLENSLFRLVDGRNIVGSPELLDERTPYGTAVFAVRRDGPYCSRNVEARTGILRKPTSRHRFVTQDLACRAFPSASSPLPFASKCQILMRSKPSFCSGTPSEHTFMVKNYVGPLSPIRLVPPARYSPQSHLCTPPYPDSWDGTS
jgi:hypothetical protein